mmetsp:Transcript_12423/g.20598  ORF Transcript_12423/g.20598 Transcript_12423/m.20598 type:complete len:259 (+) Transcript_12423:629-1405(+)
MSRSISSLVIGMDAQVETHEFIETWIIVTKHAAEISRIIQGGILGDDTVVVNIAVDNGGNFRELGNDIENILQGMDVVLRLGDTVGVGLGKLGFRLTGVKTNGELSHWVHVFGKGVEDGHDVGWKCRSGVKLDGQGISLFLGGDLRGEQEPQQRFEHGFSVTSLTRVGRKDGLTLWNSEATETNTFLSIEVGSLPKHALDSTSTTDALVDSDLTDDVTAVILLESSHGCLLLRELSKDGILQARDCSHAGSKAGGLAG